MVQVGVGLVLLAWYVDVNLFWVCIPVVVGVDVDFSWLVTGYSGYPKWKVSNIAHYTDLVILLSLTLRSIRLGFYTAHR